LILDACCGSLKIYNGLVNSLMDSGEFITVDKRKGDFSYKSENNFCKNEVIVKPIVLADMRFLPFKEGAFSAIVFDPPHLKCGATSNMFMYYGSWSMEDAVRHLRFVDSEFSRVLSKNGFLFLKTMCDRKNLYREMLKHFQFFLPIQLKRPRGTYKSPKYDADGALWLIGYKVNFTSSEINNKNEVKV